MAAGQCFESRKVVAVAVVHLAEEYSSLAVEPN